MWPSTTLGASAPGRIEFTTTNNKNMFPLDFADGASVLHAEASVVMPSDWDAGTVTAIFYWFVNSASTNSVVWQCRGRSYGDSETIDQAQGTAQVIADAGSGTANQVLISGSTPAITFAGTPAANEMVQFDIFRDPGNASDNLAATARLIGVMIVYSRA